MFDDNALDDIGDVLAAINGGFQLFVNIFPLDDGQSI